MRRQKDAHAPLDAVSLRPFVTSVIRLTASWKLIDRIFRNIAAPPGPTSCLFSSWNTLKILLHFLLVCSVSAKKQALPFHLDRLESSCSSPGPLEHSSFSLDYSNSMMRFSTLCVPIILWLTSTRVYVQIQLLLNSEGKKRAIISNIFFLLPSGTPGITALGRWVPSAAQRGLRNGPAFPPLCSAPTDLLLVPSRETFWW